MSITRSSIKKKGRDSLAGSVRTRGFKLKEGRLRLDIRKKIYDEGCEALAGIVCPERWCMPNP